MAERKFILKVTLNENDEGCIECLNDGLLAIEIIDALIVKMADIREQLYNPGKFKLKRVCTIEGETFEKVEKEDSEDEKNTDSN